MIIRTALLEGDVAEADRADFDGYMRTTVVDQIKRYPGIRDVRVRRTVQADATAPGIYMQFDLLFDNLAAMDGALASSIRVEVQETIKAGMGPFEGKVSHIVYEELT